MADCNKFEIEEAANIAKRAVEFDTNGCNVAASYFYKVASKLLLHYVDENGGQMENSKSEALRHKANEYLERATILGIFFIMLFVYLFLWTFQRQL